MRTTIALILILPALVLANTPITTLPKTISVPGSYYLAANLTFKGTANAITINADDVVLDLRGRTIKSDLTISNVSQTAGIFANSRKNITIKNGKLKHFFRGIFLEDSGLSERHLVEGVEAMECSFLGIQVKGKGSIIRNCFVNQVGQGTPTGGATSFTVERYGIHASGNGILISGNRVYNVFRNTAVGSNLSTGIYVTGYGTQILQNVVCSDDLTTTYATYGFYFDGGSHAVIGNTATLQRTCFYFHTALVAYRDNLASSFGLADFTNSGSILNDQGGN